MDHLTCTSYDPNSVRQRAALADMFVGYLMDEVARTGTIASGLPVALWLDTFLMVRAGAIVGFYSFDRTSYAVELIYVHPQCRREGIATAVLAQLWGDGRRVLRAKTPFTPSGRALMRSAGVEAVLLTRQQAKRRAATYAKDQEGWQQIRVSVREHCPHPVRGNRSRPCVPCCRKYLHSYVTSMLTPIR